MCLKCVVFKKSGCISLVPLMIRPSSWCESVFNLFFVPSWISSCFCVDGEKRSFYSPDFVDSEILIWRLTSLMNFYKRVQLLFKKRRLSDCQKKIAFVQITHLKSTYLEIKYHSWRHQQLLLVAKQLRDSTFLFEINSE